MRAVGQTLLSRSGYAKAMQSPGFFAHNPDSYRDRTQVNCNFIFVEQSKLLILFKRYGKLKMRVLAIIFFLLVQGTLFSQKWTPERAGIQKTLDSNKAFLIKNTIQFKPEILDRSNLKKIESESKGCNVIQAIESAGAWKKKDTLLQFISFYPDTTSIYNGYLKIFPDLKYEFVLTEMKSKNSSENVVEITSCKIMSTSLRKLKKGEIYLDVSFKSLICKKESRLVLIVIS
ncbi:hypothetical protein K6119_08070 [Paracrocinitomix mangrovi]|uniref:hypothetical protein n=1 Tax=Paracrocinitomix mangrovi TaxID=2862509 RepID=UPI001C8EF1F7|nr:hypothetical protein [Paracrocinitomix mangrovi]UKN03468.1 hypothetical protein K6119_08070 [Paracrocinitomix mangrovi]